jgi:hypothetical protein
MVDKKKTEKDLETLRKLTVDLAKDGHTEQAQAAVNVHDLVKWISENTTEEG